MMRIGGGRSRESDYVPSRVIHKTQHTQLLYEIDQTICTLDPYDHHLPISLSMQVF